MAKVAMVIQVSIPANSTNQNVLTQQRFERVPYQAAIGRLLCTGSAAGLTAELNVGGVSITPPTVVNANSRVPIVPDDELLGEWEALGGQLIQLSVVNTTAGALTFFAKIELQEAQLQVG